MAKSKAKAPSRPKGSLTDVQKALLDKPELLTGALVAAFFMYRAGTMKGVIGRLLLRSRFVAEGEPFKSINKTMNKIRQYYEVDLPNYEMHLEQFRLALKMYPIAEGQSLNDYHQALLQWVSPGATVPMYRRMTPAALKEWLALMTIIYNWNRDPSTYPPPKPPEEVKDYGHLFDKPDAAQVAAMGLFGFILGSKPELIPQTINAVGKVIDAGIPL